MRAWTFLTPLLASFLAATQGQPAAAASPMTFQSIELRGGGRATISYGPVRRVTVRGVNPGRPIRSEGKTLVIDRCARPCPRGHRIEVEITTPEMSGLAVTDGGLIQVLDGFPAQASVSAAVMSGGTIDMRSVAAASVSAAVSQGGRILVSPGRDMAATVADGGIITYWGDARITSSVRRGGAVVRGAAADRRLPLARFDPPLWSPPVPPAVPARLPRTN